MKGARQESPGIVQDWVGRLRGKLEVRLFFKAWEQSSDTKKFRSRARHTQPTTTNLMDSARQLVLGLFVLFHYLLGQLHLIFIEGLLAFLEDYVWPWFQDHLDEHLEEREDFIEFLNAQEAGFENVFWREEDSD